MDVLNMWDAILDVVHLKASSVNGFKNISGETVADYDEIVRRVRELRRGELDMTLARLMNLKESPADWLTLKGITIPPFVTGMKSLLAENEKILSSATSLADLKGTDVFYIKTMDGAQPENLYQACFENERLMFVEPQDYSNVNMISYAFENCYSLRAFASNGSLSAVKGVEGMFYECLSLKYVKFSEGDLENSTYAISMFQNCRSLERIFFPSRSLNDIQYMFDSCSSLKEVTFSHPLHGSISMTNAFFRCISLESIPDLSQVEEVISATRAFYGTPILDFSYPSLSLKHANDAFDNTPLKSFKVKSLETNGNIPYGSTFAACSALETVIILEECTLKTFGSMFGGCKMLREVVGLDLSALYLTRKDIGYQPYFENITGYAFTRCTSLTDCELGGTLYKSGIDLRPCVKLSARSLYTWVNALYDWSNNPEEKTTDDTDHTLYLTDAQQTTLMDYAGDDGESGEDAYLAALDKGWTISA